MSTPLAKAQIQKAGVCPHGLPPGACPICSGMGGGSVKRDNKPREMTWNECYAIGQMLKAQKMAKQHTKQMYAAQDLNSYLNKLNEQMNSLKLMIQNSFPRPIARVLSVLANVLFMPAITSAKLMQTISNGLKNVMSSMQKTFENIKQKLADISDKLSAIFGEAKASIEKKISEKFKDLKKKAFNLFGISTTDNEEDEEIEKIEQAKRIFENNQTKETLLEKKRIEEKQESINE